MDRKDNSPIVESLRHEQANAVQLYFQYKGYHWNVYGPSFHDLHLMFDAHAKDVFEMIDELAERQRILGAPAEYTLDAMRRAADLVVETNLPPTPWEMVEHLVTSHRRVMGDVKRGLELANRHEDPGTADLLTRFLLLHEKMEWFLREILESSASPGAPAASGPAPPHAKGAARPGGR